jgi:hypothetical protein
MILESFVIQAIIIVICNLSSWVGVLLQFNLQT